MNKYPWRDFLPGMERIDMTNLDKMKNYLIKVIKEMDYPQFERLVDLINESDDELFDKVFLFNCEKCKKKYGNCVCEACDDRDALGLCSERFMKYALSEEI